MTVEERVERLERRNRQFVAMLSVGLLAVFVVGCGGDQDDVAKDKESTGPSALEEQQRRQRELEEFRGQITSAGFLETGDLGELWWFRVDGTVRHAVEQPVQPGVSWWFWWGGTYTLRNGANEDQFTASCKFDRKELYDESGDWLDTEIVNESKSIGIWYVELPEGGAHAFFVRIDDKSFYPR